MRRIFTISLAALLCSTMMSKAQMPGPFYRQFYYNPYLFNPAYVAINNEVEANLSYRQQWTNFKDAPVTAGASLQFPASERVALGFNLYSDKQVLLRNSNFNSWPHSVILFIFLKTTLCVLRYQSAWASTNLISRLKN